MTDKQEFYGSMTAPASVGERDGQIYGVFYRDRMRHIAPYTPCKSAPYRTLCGDTVGVSTRTVEDLCLDCMTRAEAILGKLNFK